MKKNGHQIKLWEQTKTAISTAAQNNLPKPGKSRSPWISDEVGKLADQRRLVKARGLRSEMDRKQYKAGGYSVEQDKTSETFLKGNARR